MRLGVNATPTELATTLATFPGIASCRVFAPVGAGIPSWTRNAAMRLLRERRITAWPSFKDWTTDDEATAMITAWLDSMPTDVPEVWLTYHHEPENNFAYSREYRRRWILLARIVRAHRNGGRVKLVPIHTHYPSRHKIGDKYSEDWTKWAGVWQQWTPLNPDGSYVGDFMGWDCYLESTAKQYEDPQTFFRIPLSAAYSTGVPLVLPEWGALRIPTDTTGTGRADWMEAGANHLRVNGVELVNWWHATGTGGHDYRLDDAGIRLWNRLIATDARAFR